MDPYLTNYDLRLEIERLRRGTATLVARCQYITDVERLLDLMAAQEEELEGLRDQAARVEYEGTFRDGWDEGYAHGLEEGEERARSQSEDLLNEVLAGATTVMQGWEAITDALAQ